jgi:hypothetical protein
VQKKTKNCRKNCHQAFFVIIPEHSFQKFKLQKYTDDSIFSADCDNLEQWVLAVPICSENTLVANLKYEQASYDRNFKYQHLVEKKSKKITSDSSQNKFKLFDDDEDKNNSDNNLNNKNFDNNYSNNNNINLFLICMVIKCMMVKRIIIIITILVLTITILIMPSLKIIII